MRLRCFALLLCVLWTVKGDDIGLCRIGDVWRFTGSVPPASLADSAWAQPDYDDSIWNSGRSGFSAGYLANEATVLPVNFTNSHSIFFRHSFQLDDPLRIRWLTLRLDYADGFIAYLNGREVARRNVQGQPGSPVSLDRLATDLHARGDVEELDISGSLAQLRPGTNTLAIQLLPMRAESGVVCLSPELLANFTRGPMLQNTSTNHVQIIWKTPVPADTRVTFGVGTNLDRTYLDTNLVTTHVTMLTNLVPDTLYSYTVSSFDGQGGAQSHVAHLRTFKMSGDLSFVAFGDGGWNSIPQYQIGEVMRTSASDLVIEVGDTVYPSFTSALVDPHCLSVYQRHMENTPYFFAIGNHDLLSGVTNYLDAFYLPTNSIPLGVHVLAQTSPEHYYSFDHGDAHFTVLFVPFIHQYKLTEGDPQYTWLTNDLATTSKPWKIVLYHVPMNSSSAHRFDDNNLNGIYDRLEIRDVLLPVLSRYGVQLTLCGHEHGYERFNPTNGVHFITTAGGGAELYGFSELDVASALFSPRPNCVKVTIHGDTLEAQALGTDGAIFDSMSIQRRAAHVEVYNATWNSPFIENSPANDLDGNIFGQTFNLQGQPIPAVSGQFSNLGRAYVNNDSTNLYIGFERVMIYGNNNIFLFLESPRTDGVVSLANIGNGVIDPTGQGADGLDFLANLSFTNFTPSVACLLGDEFADGQYRSFVRTNLLLDIGQGVFRLDQTLSDLPNTRLQQFHLSPQTAGALAEQNANFIEVAIPLSELGGLGSGDLIRIGAIVGGEKFDLQNQTRLLDSGFLGNSFLSSGNGPAVLEGLPVRLAFDPLADADQDGLIRSQELALGTDPANPDTDGDGLPDGWEVSHGLNPLRGDAMDGADGDPDGDGFSNRQEYQAGTDPHNSASLLKLQWQRVGLEKVRLTWNVPAGVGYQLQSTPASPFDFKDVQDGRFLPTLIATNLSYELDLPILPSAARFYRLRLTR